MKLFIFVFLFHRYMIIPRFNQTIQNGAKSITMHNPQPFRRPTQGPQQSRFLKGSCHQMNSTVLFSGNKTLYQFILTSILREKTRNVLVQRRMTEKKYKHKHNKP